MFQMLTFVDENLRTKCVQIFIAIHKFIVRKAFCLSCSSQFDKCPLKFDFWIYVGRKATL